MPTDTPPRSARRVMRRHRRRALTGAVYAEAIMVMGTMILLFYLIDFVHDGYSKTMVAGTQTRGAGWVHVMEPCQNEVAAPTLQQSEGNWGVGSLGALAFAREALSIGSKQPGLIGYRNLITFKVPQHRFSQVDNVTRPDAIGGEARFGHQIVLSCNEDLEDIEMGSIKFGLWTEFAWRRAGL